MPAPKAETNADKLGASDADVASDVRAGNAFALKVYGRARKTPGNVMLSGTSLRRALSAAYLGAAGETASEMARTLELSTDVQKASALARAESDAWQSARGTKEGAKDNKDAARPELVVADRLWADKAFAIKPDYTKLVETALGASTAPVDFVHGTEEARTTINGWVAQKTADKIKDLLPKGSVDARTRVVITNAIYFKAKWSLPFQKTATKDEAFTTAAGKKVTTALMHETETHRIADAAGAKALEMHYDGGDLSMLVLLPNDAKGLDKLEDAVAKGGLDTWTKALASSRVAVTLPKFTFQWGGAMNAALQDLGMKAAFTPKADFAGIADPQGTERLFISDVVHKTWVAVDESGTEAAAATGVVMRTTSMPVGPVVEFKADHPFLFFIRDTKSERILFVGRVSDPKAS
ncbi:Serine protease inhibitor (serpin family) [Labilithrix luteola]|uniref:Serine protease inhibitor (Serpin family) n=1 Tax=Labilithrix luteola TaxID=1391654 RepID=A0A0K1PLD9_9BACT|nr:serpin family protein [Labilithrix luteola]AKU94348.1 Serine protease inhibitor (serpin family) [Labilithrix luteola]